jgi:hypothetical protein
LPVSDLRRPRKIGRSSGLSFAVAPYAVGDGGGLSAFGRF